MMADELRTETRVALREAEELLDKLPPLSPDHETVRTVVVQLRQSLRSARDSTEMSRRTLNQSRAMLENGRNLILKVGKRVQARQRPTTAGGERGLMRTAIHGVEQGTGNGVSPRKSHGGATSVFLDLDTVLLDSHQGKYGPELAVQADIPVALKRMSEVADKVIVIVNPKPADGGHVMDTNHRLDVLRSGLNGADDRLLIVTCPHGENGKCDCAKPGNGLVVSTLREHGFDSYLGWYVGGDQEGVVCGRTAGLRTIRIGPHRGDHLSDVHRPDFEARDLMDAANRILLETLAAD